MAELNRDIQKQKVTLTIDKEIVNRAKNAKINISATAENVLKALTFHVGEGSTRDDVIEAYEKLLYQMRVLLNEYDTRINIGRRPFQRTGRIEEIQLDVYGGIVIIYPTEKDKFGIVEYSVSQALDYLYSPSVILQNLIAALVKAANKNEKKIMDLKMALRLVKALSDNGEDE